VKFAALSILLYAGGAVAQPTPLLQVSGMVTHPGPVPLDRSKSVTVAATFKTMHGPQSHRWSGPLLLDLINLAGVKDEPGKKTHMRHVIMAQGADGYAVCIAIGEIDTTVEGKQVIVAVRQDDAPLASPRLVVPGDASFARGVHDLKTLEIR
jgi:hypothetical protein